MRRLTRRAWVASACALAAAADSPSADAAQTRRAREAEARAAPLLAEPLARIKRALGAPVYLRITKEPARLEAWLGDQSGAYALMKSYPICAISGGLGPKLREGDRQAPEGFYEVRPQQMNPASAFHLSFDLGFPNAWDRAHGRTGSFLMVHGGCASIGCYAMTNPAIEEIWTIMARAFRAGAASVPVHCFPFPFTAEALSRRQGDPNSDFWKELAPAWSSFEETRRVPTVAVLHGRYMVRPG